MTKRVGNLTIIEITDNAQCELCGVIDELRPYGPGGKNICFECGEKDRETTEARMRNVMFDVPLPDDSK